MRLLALAPAALAAAALAAAAAAPAGCYDPPFAECTIQCGPGGTCPSGSTCDLDDGYCHVAAAACGTPVAASALDLGLGHGCTVRGDGDLHCWGDNAFGQVDPALGADAVIPTPRQVGAGTAWRRVSAGQEHTCAIRRDDGALLCWGAETLGRLGGDRHPQSRMAVVMPGSAWVDVSAGASHTCAVRDGDGTIWCWGDNAGRALGSGGPLEHGPALVPGPGSRATAVAAGWRFTCAIREPAELWCWGDLPGRGDNAQDVSPAPLADSGPSDWTRLSASAGHLCGLRAGGALACWGEGSSGQLGDGMFLSRATPGPVPGSWREVSAGHAFTCGLRTDGSAACWGDNLEGSLGNDSLVDSPVPAPLASPVAAWRTIAAGGRHACAVAEADGALFCWGSNATGQAGNGSWARKTSPVRVENTGSPTTWIDVAPGGYHSCGIGTDRTLHCWGANLYGQLGVGDRAPRSEPQLADGSLSWKKVSAGLYHSCALEESGMLFCWGRNDEGQVAMAPGPDQEQPVSPSADTWTDVAAGDNFTCGIRVVAFGSQLTCWGAGFEGAAQAILPDLADWTAVSAGPGRVCAVNAERVHCWPLDRGEVPPVEPVDPEAWRVVSAGADHQCGLRVAPSEAFEPHCWGGNDSWQLGFVGPSPQLPVAVDVPIAADGDWLQVASGWHHSCAVDALGGLYCWGLNTDGQTGRGDVASPALPSQVTSDDGAAAWTKIAAGRAHTCAIAQGGPLYCWGANGQGQLGDGTGSVLVPTQVAPFEE